MRTGSLRENFGGGGTVKAFKVRSDDTDRFEEILLAEPVPSGRDILVQVKAVSLNPVDTQLRPTRPNRVLGWDAAGEVVAVGSAVETYRPGDAVFYAGAIQRDGANAQLHLVDERLVGTKPKTLDWAQAAAAPLTTLTAWEGLIEQLRVQRGKRVLVVNGAGGVGSMAIQLAKNVCGLEVVATASRSLSRQWVLDLGADHVLNHHGDLPAQLAELGIPLVDYVFCCHSTERHFADMTRVLAPRGHILSIVEANTPLPMGLLFQKKATFSWQCVFTKPLRGSTGLASHADILNRCSALFDAGSLRSTLHTHGGELCAEQLDAGHRQTQSGTNIGKLAFTMPSA